MSSSLPSSWLMRQLSPRWFWCRACQRKIPAHMAEAHHKAPLHGVAVRKMSDVDDLALGMWEEHRGAAVGEEAASMPAVRRALAAQQRRQARSQAAAPRLPRGW